MPEVWNIWLSWAKIQPCDARGLECLTFVSKDSTLRCPRFGMFDFYEQRFNLANFWSISYRQSPWFWYKGFVCWIYDFYWLVNFLVVIRLLGSDWFKRAWGTPPNPESKTPHVVLYYLSNNCGKLALNRSLLFYQNLESVEINPQLHFENSECFEKKKKFRWLTWRKCGCLN